MVGTQIDQAIQRKQARDVLMAQQDDVQFVALLTRKIGSLLRIESAWNPVRKVKRQVGPAENLRLSHSLVRNSVFDTDRIREHSIRELHIK